MKPSALILATLVALAAPSARADEIDCTLSAQALEGPAGTVHQVTCPAWCDVATVWGSGIYSDDSSVCTAARHAGVLGPGGGTTILTIAAGLDAYRGSEMNGVVTLDWGQWGRSFVFGRTAVLGCFDNAQALLGDVGATWTVSCPAGCIDGGAVWGTGTYSDDSAVCRAAVHAGAIGSDGGQATLRILAGQPSYTASTLNDVNSLDWGEWARSFSFEL